MCKTHVVRSPQCTKDFVVIITGNETTVLEIDTVKKPMKVRVNAIDISMVDQEKASMKD